MNKSYGVLAALALVVVTAGALWGVDAKVTALTEATVAAITDVIYIVADPGGTPISKKITIANLFTSPALTTPTATTPSANDNDTSVATTAYVQTELTAYASDTVTRTNFTLNAESTGNVITIPGYWDMDLVSVVSGVAAHVWNDDPLSTACTPLAVTGTNRTTGVCTFPDSDGEYGRQISRYLPTGWTGSFDAEIWWKTTGTGNARFRIAVVCYADNEIDDAAFPTDAGTLVTAAAGTSGRPNKQTITGITTTSGTCAAEELMRIRFSRNRTEGSDTLNAALDVEKVIFKFRVAH
jgi:hypothetical protein